MPEDTKRAEPNEEVNKRAYKRVGAAVALALAASVAVTFLTHRKPPPAPVVEPEQTVLPAEPSVSALQATSGEAPASAVAEIPAAPDAPPAIAPPSPPPPPQVVNGPQEINVPDESAPKTVKPIATKPPKEKEAEPATKPVLPAAAEKSAKPHAVLELVPAPLKEAKTGEVKKPLEAHTEPAKPAASVAEKRTAPESAAPVKEAKTEPKKPVANAPHSQAESTSKPRADLELVPVAPFKEAATKDGEAKKPLDARAEPAKPAPGTPAAQPAGAAAKGYAVQLGVFSNPSNAIQMQEKLTQHGIQSFTETKLNVGTFQNKAEAEQAMAKVRGLGIGAVVVQLH